MAEPSLACLLPAAGASARLGRPKQLVELEGESLVRRAAGLLLEHTSNLVVVTGAHQAEVSHALHGLPAALAHNPEWRTGLGSSIAAGMRALGEDADGVLILLVDQWRIGAGDLAALAGAWRGEPSAVAAASFDETLGPPAIFPRRLFGELRGLRGEAGAKRLIEADARVLRVNMPHARYDLDTPEDGAALTPANS